MSYDVNALVAKNIFQHVTNGIMITDAEGVIMDVNPSFCINTGYSREEMVGQSPEILYSGYHEEGFYEHLWESIQRYGYWQGEVWNRRKEGALCLELLTINAVIVSPQAAPIYVSIFSNISSEQLRNKARLEFAFYDPLTQLPNRQLLMDRLNSALCLADRAHVQVESEAALGLQVALLFIDLDQFKPINDRYGHACGDRVLVEIARRLKAQVRETDTVSRYGGDEFVLVFPGTQNKRSAKIICEKIHRALVKPFKVDQQIMHLGVSIGVSFYNADGEDAESLIKAADEAMYYCKQHKTGQFCVFYQDLKSVLK